MQRLDARECGKERDEVRDCDFCNDSVRDRVITESDLYIAFPTNIPIVPGHVVIAPKRHVATFEDLNTEEKLALFELMAALKKALARAFDAEGFNIAWNQGAPAGQVVSHFHVQILPRKIGDTGITQYEPRTFLYRPGKVPLSPLAELIDVAGAIRAAL